MVMMRVLRMVSIPLAMSLLMYSGKEAGRVEGLGPDLLRVYDATDDVILRANIASNWLRPTPPRSCSKRSSATGR